MVSELDIRKYKETLLEFLSDVTTIHDETKKHFIEGNMNGLFDAPNGYKVLSPFLLVKVKESTRVEKLVGMTPPEGEKPQPVKPKIETYECHISFKLYTENYEYCISAIWEEYHLIYLGCTSDARKPRAGEDWTRGNDMYDGYFCRETWNKIKSDILKSEMKGIAKYIVNGRYTKEN